MKAIVHDATVKSLPEEHVAVLFEGAWLFTQDPGDRSRILAICPYTDADDHVCELGRWDSSAVPPNRNFVGPSTQQTPLIIAEASLHRIEVAAGARVPQSFTEFFDRAAASYPFIYLKNLQRGQPISLSSNSKVRKISIPMPDEVRPAGQLLDVPIVPASSSFDAFQISAAGDAVSSYVTFVFLYLGASSGAAVTLHRVGSSGTIQVQDTSNPHLIFRVHGKSSIPVDSYTDHVHMVSTFDTLRKLVQVPDPSSASHKLIPCDFGMFPASGNQRFSAGDTGLSVEELGLSKPKPSQPTVPEDVHTDLHVPTALNLASCAGGGIVCSVDDNG